MQSWQWCRYLGCLPLVVVAACGGLGGGSNAELSAGRTITGQSAWLPVPATEAQPTFTNLSLAFVSFEALLGGNTLAPLGPPAALRYMSGACATAGCPFQQDNVDLTTAQRGAFALIAPSDAESAASFVPTATMVINPNQLLQSRSNRVAVASQGQAQLMSVVGLASLAKVLGLPAAELMARGVAIGVVTSARNFSAGAPPALSGAYVTLVDAPSGAAIYTVDASWQNITKNGTASHGAVVVVGPTTPTTGGRGVAIGVQVEAPGNPLVWPSQAVIVNPACLTISPILPYP